MQLSRKRLSCELGFSAVLLVMLWIVAGCDIADEDRCPSGFHYDKELKSCLLDEEPTDTDTGDPTDAGTGDSGLEGGWGVHCEDDGDCIGFEADFCLVNPFASEEGGYCSLDNCNSGDCGEGFTCCDCTSLSWIKACIDDENAATAAQYGCECS